MIASARTPDEKLSLVSYIAQRMDCPPLNLVGDMPFEVIGVLSSQGKIRGAVLYTNYRHGGIEMTCAGEPGWLSKDAVKAFFVYPFQQIGCHRVTSLVPRKNKPSRTLAERLGFKLEGVIREGFVGATTQDAMLYGLLKSDCIWIR